MITLLKKWLSRSGGSPALGQPHCPSQPVETRSAPVVEPTVFHITHWKAGSQWIHRIFHALVYDRLVLPRWDQSQFLRDPIQSGKVYPTVYVTKEQFDAVSKPPDHRRFVIIRDLRDTLVSLYFSMKTSHDIPNDYAAGLREALQLRGPEEGMLFTMDNLLPLSAAIQESWLKAREPLVRYEELLRDDLHILRHVLLEKCELSVAIDRLRQAVHANRFEALTGRLRGQEDRAAHERKGIAGDWRNYFTPKIKSVFKDRFGHLLCMSGYEKDLEW
jgi:hypothetical protein